MGLKFRRGTTAQKSGSLAYGEPYVNTDLGTLQIGGATGDITLGASGTGSAAQFSTISGSGLRITGNAQVDGNLTLGGNITIGDNTADSVTVVASLSSSLIPSSDSIFDLGSPTKQWRDLYLSSASLYIDGTQVLSSNATELIFTTDTGQSIKFNELGTDNITLQTVDGDIELKSSGGGDVLLDPTTGIISVKGNVSMQDGTAKFLSSGGNDIVFGNNLVVTGSITTTGNVNIGGNITIGDNTSDTVNMTAALSSSLIPSVTNAFDLGSVTKVWRDLYISTGSIKMVSNGVVVSTLSNTGNGFALDQGVTANGDSSFGTSSAAITAVTGSLKVSGSISLIGALSASTITGIGNVTAFSTSVDSRLVAAESFSSSLDTTFATDASVTIVSASAWGAFQSASSYSASIYTRDANQDTNITANSASAWGAFQSASSYSGSFYTTINTAIGNTTQASASAWGAFQSASSYSGSFYTTINTNIGNITQASASAAGAFASASAYSASAVTTYAKLAVANTFTANQIVSGSITATGDVVAYSTSDKRHKHNIVLISDALSKVTKLNGVTWEWNDDVDAATKETPKTGLIAQEVQEVLPEVVKERGDGFLALDYSKMMGLMVEAIKEQQIQIEKLRMDLDNYECKCDNCKSK